MEGPTSLLRTPPGRVFHVVLVPLALAVLWAYSFPGFGIAQFVVAAFLLAGAGLVWAARLIGYAVTRRWGRGGGRAWWFVVAPLGAVVVVALVWGDIPLRARWALSRSAFEKAAAEVVRDRPVADVESRFERRIGLYRITRLRRAEAGVIFYERTGLVLHEAGLAYLPNGPSPELENGLFEAPRYRALGRGWYTWTASW